MAKEMYILLSLKYGYAELGFFISKEQLRIHHNKHQQVYVTNVNSILQTMDKARVEGTDFDYRANAKTLAFNFGGHVLHDYFW